MKTCKRCAQDRPTSQYGSHPKTRDRLQPICRNCKSEIEKERYRRKKADGTLKKLTPRQQRNKDLRRNFGITIEEYEEKLDAQSGACAICLLPPKADRQLAVDHDHATGKVRGLLCIGCNVSLGHFRDSPEILLRAIHYLGR